MKKTLLTISLLTIATSSFAGAPNSSAASLDTKKEQQISEKTDNQVNLDAEKNEVSFSCTDQDIAQ